MALYRSLPVYKATYSLLLSVQRMIPNMQRDVRYTLGQGLTKLLMNMIVLIYETNMQRDKAPYIRRNRNLLVEVETTIRILCDLHQISEGQYAMLIELEFLGAFIKPYRIYPSSSAWHRMNKKVRTAVADKRLAPKELQAKVNSHLGVMCHYDCYNIRRKFFGYESGLTKKGTFDRDTLRWYPMA